MSRSPRKLLRSAALALDTLHDVCTQSPEARAEVERALGPERYAALEAARGVVLDAADVFEQVAVARQGARPGGSDGAGGRGSGDV